MTPANVPNNRDCDRTQALLTDYLDNALSARAAWQVEKHLADCADCAALSREMRATVHLLQNASRLDTGEDFMARLHARLDTLEPEAMRPRTLLETLRDGWEGARAALRSRAAPALGLGFAMTTLVAVVLLSRPVPSPRQADLSAEPGPATVIAAEPIKRNIAISASDPLGDPAAAILEARSVLSDSNADAIPTN